jgi:hypothetical protein
MAADFLIISHILAEFLPLFSETMRGGKRGNSLRYQSFSVMDLAKFFLGKLNICRLNLSEAC